MLTHNNLLGLLDDKEIMEYNIKNKHGICVHIMNYGATVTKLMCPDNKGVMGDIVLGFDEFDGYLQRDNPFMNCIVGRYANRIAKSQFSLDGVNYTINSNSPHYSLHGGITGFDKKIWNVVYQSEDTLILNYYSKDGEEGFPGNMEVEVKYMISEFNELHMEYTATIDTACPVNLTNHCYFNLSAGSDKDILNHDLRVIADYITALDENSIPTGQLMAVKDTVYDLNERKNIGNQFKQIDGYDHNWVVGTKSERPKFVASLFHNASGRVLEVFTTEPGIQVYTANGFDGSLKNTKANQSYEKYGAICLETQMYPDSPNHDNFPNTILYPDEEYKQHTIYKMKVID